MATKPAKKTKATKTTKTAKNNKAAKNSGKIEQENYSSAYIQKTIQSFVIKSKNDNGETNVYRKNLLPSIFLIVLFGISFGTGGLLPAAAVSGLAVTQFFSNIFANLGSDILWDVIQTFRNSKQNQPTIEAILENHNLIKAIKVRLDEDPQFETNAGRLFDLTDALSTFTDQARELKYDEIIQELCNELKAHRQILESNKADLEVVLGKDWDGTSLGYSVLEKTLRYTAEETVTSNDRKIQDTAISSIETESSYKRLVKRFRVSPLPTQVLLLMLSWIASILIAVWLLHLLSYSSSWCGCDQFSLIPILTSTPIVTSTITLIPTTTLTTTATITALPTNTQTITVTPTYTATLKALYEYKLKHNTYLYTAPGSKVKVTNINFTPDPDLLIGYSGYCVNVANQSWLSVNFSFKLENGARRNYPGWIVWSAILDFEPSKCSETIPTN